VSKSRARQLIDEARRKRRELIRQMVIGAAIAERPSPNERPTVKEKAGR